MAEAKQQTEAQRLAEIAATQAANEKAGLIFPPGIEESPEPTLAQKRAEHYAKIEELTEDCLAGKDCCAQLSTLIEAYKILYQC